METQKNFASDERLRDNFLRFHFDISKFENAPGKSNQFITDSAEHKDNVSRFKDLLDKVLSPNLPAKDLVELIIRSALEIEFGPSFVLSPGFRKMSEKIADSIMVNPALRRQILAASSQILGDKIARQKIN